MKRLLIFFLLALLLAGCAAPAVEVSTDPNDPLFNMVYVPTGKFQMGCSPDNNGGFTCLPDELPLHTVKLSPYYIDKYEVTNMQYAACVAAGVCDLPSDLTSETRATYYDDPEFAVYPVVYVSWIDAAAYCDFVGKRLPSEAEWEKAARGTNVRLYPWGDEVPNCTLANAFDIAASRKCVGDTTAVGSHPTGASPYGVEDMAGSVWEWVNDWYSETYYAESPSTDPTGPSSGTYRALRGGGWEDAGVFIRTASRNFDLDFNSGRDAGFRCAVSAGQ